MNSPIPTTPWAKISFAAYLQTLRFRLKTKLWGAKAGTEPHFDRLLSLWRRIGKGTLPSGYRDTPSRKHLPFRLTEQSRFHRTHVDDFAPELFEEMAREADKRLSDTDVAGIMKTQRREKKGKYFKIQMNGNMYANPLESPFTRYALQDKFLNVVRDYLGCPIRLHSTELYYDFPIDDEPIASQHWHMDGLDFLLVKIFTYLSDVNEETGSLALVDSDISRDLRFRLSEMKEYENRDHNRMNLIHRLVPKEKRHRIHGPRGTLVFADTAMSLHRGVPQLSKSRYMFVATYTSPIPYDEWPHSRYRRRLNKHYAALRGE